MKKPYPKAWFYEYDNQRENTETSAAITFPQTSRPCKFSGHECLLDGAAQASHASIWGAARAAPSPPLRRLSKAPVNRKTEPKSGRSRESMGSNMASSFSRRTDSPMSTASCSRSGANTHDHRVSNTKDF